MRMRDCSSDVCSSDLKVPIRLAYRSRCRSASRNRKAGLRRLHLADASVAQGAGVRRPNNKDTTARIRNTKNRILAIETAKILFRSEEHTSELQSLMRISYAVFCLKKKIQIVHQTTILHI